MPLRRPFQLGILEKPTPFPGMYCEWAEGVGGSGSGRRSCLPSTTRPLGVSADPPAQTILPKASQASQEGGFVANLPRLGWGAGLLESLS